MEFGVHNRHRKEVAVNTRGTAPYLLAEDPWRRVEWWARRKCNESEARTELLYRGRTHDLSGDLKSPAWWNRLMHASHSCLLCHSPVTMRTSSETSCTECTDFPGQTETLSPNINNINIFHNGDTMGFVGGGNQIFKYYSDEMNYASQYFSYIIITFSAHPCSTFTAMRSKDKFSQIYCRSMRLHTGFV